LIWKSKFTKCVVLSGIIFSSTPGCAEKPISADQKRQAFEIILPCMNARGYISISEKSLRDQLRARELSGPYGRPVDNGRMISNLNEVRYRCGNVREPLEKLNIPGQIFNSCASYSEDFAILANRLIVVATVNHYLLYDFDVEQKGIQETQSYRRDECLSQVAPWLLAPSLPVPAASNP
jgi:hypothetical protein